MEVRFTDGYLEEEAQIRFSDFTEGGKLQYSKCLMYFEKSRFRVSDISGIAGTLRADNDGKEPAFVVTRVDIEYLTPVRIPDGEFTRKILVRTKLVYPVISKLSFFHELVDERTGRIMIKAKVDTVVLFDEKMVMRFSDNAHKCLDRYLKISGMQGD